MKRISWDKQAVVYFRKFISYIREESSQSADKVKREILQEINELSVRPEIHGPDKYKLNDSGNYRAFELHRLRIGYMIKEDEIVIARIRNTKQEPLDY